MKTYDELKRYNIRPIRELTKKELEHIAIQAVSKIEKMIVEFDGEYMYEQIMNAKIYLAKIPEQYTDVNYIIFTNSIYIRSEKNIEEIDEIMLHELFHYIQCNQGRNNKKGTLEQMGLCRFHSYKITGLAINEVAIQLIISIVFNNEKVNTNKYGININAIEDKTYPILCALMQQITYILGYKELLKSILKNTDDFQDLFESFAGIQSYSFLRQAFDKMMNSRDSISNNIRLINTEENVQNKKILEKEIEIYTQEIKNHFSAVQKLCYTEYFEPLFKKVKTKEDLIKVRKEVNNYHQHTGTVDGKDEFMIYAQKQLLKLNNKIR